MSRRVSDVQRRRFKSGLRNQSFFYINHFRKPATIRICRPISSNPEHSSASQEVHKQPADGEGPKPSQQAAPKHKTGASSGLSRNKALRKNFTEKFGVGYRTVRDYYLPRKESVVIQDVSPFVPGLVAGY
jgi:hypothetical protein